MKKIAILVFFTVGFFVHVWACTGLIAGEQATVDGSVLVNFTQKRKSCSELLIFILLPNCQNGIFLRFLSGIRKKQLEQ